MAAAAALHVHQVKEAARFDENAALKQDNSALMQERFALNPC